MSIVLLAAGFASMGRAKDDGIRLIPEMTAAQPGHPFTVAIEIHFPAQWHTYWINSGDVGAPPLFNWKLPAAITSPPTLRFPTPTRYEDAGLISYGHASPLHVLAEFQLAPTAPEKTLTLAVEADWLICREVCEIRQGTATLAIPVRREPPSPLPENAALFKPIRAALPTPDPRWRAAFSATPDAWLLHLTAPDDIADSLLDRAAFFPAHPGLTEPAQPAVWSREEIGWTLRLPKGAEPLPPNTPLEGVLVFPSDVQPVWLTAAPRPAARQPVPHNRAN